MGLRERLIYAALAFATFWTELAIALFVHDGFIRGSFGDALAVVLVYLVLRAVTPLGIGWALGLSLAYAFAAEIGQYYHLIDVLGLGRNFIARMVLGTTFDPQDFVCYTVGAAGVALVEFACRRRAGGGR